MLLVELARIATVRRARSMAAERSSKFDAAAYRLKCAYDKSKKIFLEEAEDILRNTLSSPSTCSTSGAAEGKNHPDQLICGRHARGKL